MVSLSSLFSSYDYYENYNFQRLLRNWNTYMDSEGESDDMMSEWEEWLLKDFLDGSREWLKKNNGWAVGLELE